MSKQRFKTVHTSALTSKKLAHTQHATFRLYWCLHLASDGWGMLSADPYDVQMQAVPGVDGFSLTNVTHQLDVLDGLKLIERWVYDDTPWLYLTGYEERLSANQKRNRSKAPRAVPPSRGGTRDHVGSTAAVEPHAFHSGMESPSASQACGTTANISTAVEVSVVEEEESSKPLLQQRDTGPIVAVVDDESEYERRQALAAAASVLPPVKPNPLDVLGTQIDQSLTDRLTKKLTEIMSGEHAARFAGLITGSKIMGTYPDGAGDRRKFDAGTWERSANVVVRLVAEGKLKLPGDGPIGCIITRLPDHTEPGSDQIIEQKRVGVRIETADDIKAKFMRRAEAMAGQS